MSIECLARWYDIREVQPEHRAWVLVAHKDYDYPIAAQFYKHPEWWTFAFYTDLGYSCETIDLKDDSISSNKIRYWCRLPAKPKVSYEKVEAKIEDERLEPRVKH